MTFEEYIARKKIDGKAFRENEPERWKEWEAEFNQIHPDSFTTQKLYLINPIRRKYPLKEEIKPSRPDNYRELSGEKPATQQAKPIIKPRPKIN